MKIELTLKDKKLAEKPEVKTWLKECEKRLEALYPLKERLADEREFLLYGSVNRIVGYAGDKLFSKRV